MEQARAEGLDLDRAAEVVKEEARSAYEGSIPQEAATRLEQTTSYWMNTWGYMRYFDKREEQSS